jgi:hypothetical protein
MAEKWRVSQELRSLAPAGDAVQGDFRRMLRTVLDAQNAYAKAELTLQNAAENYSDPSKEQDAFCKAASAASEVEKAARAMLATAPTAPQQDEGLRAVLEGLECEEIDTLMLAKPEILRAVGVEIAKAAKLWAAVTTAPQQSAADYLDELAIEHHSTVAPQQEAVAWRVRLGDSNMWGYCDGEWEADFNIRQSGMKKYEKQPLYASPQAPR